MPSAPARDRILFHLKMHGPQTAAQIARRLKVTPMAVRQHFYLLTEEGLVEYRDERRKVGRPARVWSATAKAAARFPDTHGELTVDLLQDLRVVFGAKGVDRLLAERMRRQLERYRQRMPTGKASLEERVAALAAIRREEGYMAESSPQRDGSLLLAENHCPICAAASVCQGLCRDELALFRVLLGKDVSVERTDHILAGARRCAYRIAPTRNRA